MARRVFFSFHHQKDSWRASQIRNSWIGQKGDTNTFMDAAAWEKVRRRGDDAVKAWIDKEMLGTGVTVVLIGELTATRPYVRYEIQQSVRKKKGLLGIYIHKVKVPGRKTSRRGHNPLHDFTVLRDHPWFGLLGFKSEQRLSDMFQTFDWVQDEGRQNMSEWIEEAARRADR